jgi:DNA-3-methyladenine glycosylase I
VSITDPLRALAAEMLDDAVEGGGEVVQRGDQRAGVGRGRRLREADGVEHQHGRRVAPAELAPAQLHLEGHRARRHSDRDSTSKLRIGPVRPRRANRRPFETPFAPRDTMATTAAPQTISPPPAYCEVAAGHPVHGPYHDTEYGFPLREDDALFERLVLEINQAGLSWLTILKKREGFRRAYDGFHVETVAAYGDAERARLLGDAGIVRNRLKVGAAIENARRIVALRPAHGSLAGWLDAHHPRGRAEWQRLFKRTFVFTGGEIVGEFLKSTGYLPGAHGEGCAIYDRVVRLSPPWLRAAQVPHDAPAGVGAFLSEHPPALVLSVLGSPEERVHTGWHALGYRDAQAGYLCGIFPRAAEVRLLFEHGAGLGDPDALLTGGGRQTRYLALRPDDAVPEPEIRRMLERAVLPGAVR